MTVIASSRANSLEGLGALGANVYVSGQDFTAVRASDTQLTIAGLPFDPTVGQFKFATRTDTNNNKIVYAPEFFKFSWVSVGGGGGTLTVASAAFAAADNDIVVVVTGPTRGYDAVGDQYTQWQTNPSRLAYDGAGISLISAAQNFTAAWVDLGTEVSMAGYNNIALYVTLDINAGANLRVRALAKHTSGGAEEYTLPIETIGASDIKVEAAYWEFNVDTDQLMVLPLDTNNTIPYVQYQIQAGTVGGPAQMDAAYYIRGWK